MHMLTPSSTAIAEQDTTELTEMRSLFIETKDLTEGNVAYVEMIANTEQTRQGLVITQNAQPQQKEEGELTFKDHLNLGNISHELIVVREQIPFPENIDSEQVFGALHDYGWETDDETLPSEWVVEAPKHCYRK